jgi:hypothetical protein
MNNIIIIGDSILSKRGFGSQRIYIKNKAWNWMGK